MRLDRLKRLALHSQTRVRHLAGSIHPKLCSPYCSLAKPTETRLTGGGSIADADADSVDQGCLVLSDSDSDGSILSSFLPEEWIGCGKTWSDELPRCVKAACCQSRAIPDTALPVLLPPRHLHVSTILVSHCLPPTLPVSGDSLLYIAEEPNVLTKDPSSAEFHDELQRLCHPSILPVFTHLGKFLSGFQDAWLSGAKSIFNLDTFIFTTPVPPLVGDAAC